MNRVTNLREGPPGGTAASRPSTDQGGPDGRRIGYAARVSTPFRDDASGLPPIPAAERGDRARCSFAQEQFWFVDQVTPGNVAHNFSWPVRLRGPLDVDALRRALAEVVRRHKALRTGFAVEDGGPVQVVSGPETFTLDIADVSHDASPETAARGLVDEETRRPFDLRERGLFRARLIRLRSSEHILHLVVHHIVFDEWSKVVLYRELGVLYDAYAAGIGSPLADPALQYADFAEWQRSELTEEALADDLAYWASELASAPTVLELPSDRPRPQVASLRGGRLRLPMPSDLKIYLV
jgi:hypothetical protein